MSLIITMMMSDDTIGQKLLDYHTYTVCTSLLRPSKIIDHISKNTLIMVHWYILLLQVFFLSAMFSAGDVVLLVAQTKRVKKLEEKVKQ